MNKRELLIPALRQYRHNNDDRLVHGYGLIEAQNVVKGLLDRIVELEMGVIDLKACLRTCYNTSSGVLDQHKDL